MGPIKVFITEDESIVREGLRDMIPWAQYGFTFVGDAPDGEIALPLIRKLKPDILITDIKMPFMDGLALSDIVSRELPETKIIILSGYSDFEYARQAIKLNVDQYLLKPITKTAMIQALEQTRRKIEEEDEQKGYLRKYEQEFKKFERLSRRAFFEKLVEGSMPVREIYEEAEKLHLDLTADGFNLVLFTIRSASDTEYSETAAEVQESLLDSFLRYPDYLLFRCGLLSYALLIKSGRENLAAMTERGVELIRQRCEAEPSLNWAVAVGAPTYRLSGLPKCFADASHVLAYRHILPEQHVFTTEMLRTEHESGSGGDLNSLEFSRIDPALIRGFVLNGTAEETETFAQEYLENLEDAVHSVLLRHYLMVGARVSAELALQSLGCDLEEYRRRVPTPELSLPPEGMQDYLTGVLRPALELRDEAAQRQNGDIVQDALRYIDENYADGNISLNSVARAINISANYLSAMFSQKMGVSFVEYLTQKRMARARQLLRQTGKRSGEIAAEVGYRDPRYFSFVFKKTQGCTPKAYRAGGQEKE